MRNKKQLLIGGASLLTIAVMVSGLLFLNRPQAHASSNSHVSFQQLKVAGHTGALTKATSNAKPNNAGNGKGGAGVEYAPIDDQVSVKVSNGNSGNITPPSSAPNPSNYQTVTVNNQALTNFNGLNHFNQRTANGGNQFSLEPPDQGLCSNGSLVLEPVNDVIGLYSTSGTLLDFADLNSFFGLAPQRDRTHNISGPFLSDPKCLYDYKTQRWILSILEEDNGGNVGATGRNYNLFAVSADSSPFLGGGTAYQIDVTDDGLNGTPAHAGCPCFGDQPLIGEDNYGFYISTNEFGSTFNGAQIYAMSKTLLAASASVHGPLPTVVHLNVADYLAPFGGTSYSVQPMVRAPGDNADASTQAALNGAAYFLSALQFGPAPSDNRIAAWALTNTKSLNTGIPDIAVHVDVINSETYTAPNPVTQRASPLIPLGNSLGDSESQLNSNDDRMNQVTYAQGILYSGVNTALVNGQVGFAWFEVIPGWSGSSFVASMHRQGYIAAAGTPGGSNPESVLFGSVAVNSHGRGVVSFTLVGPGYFPTAAYIRIDDSMGGVYGHIHNSGQGVGPADGFTGYPQYTGGTVERWGDYGAALAVPDGSIWMSSEYIGAKCTNSLYAIDTTCGSTRTALANWDTFVSNVGTGVTG